MFVKKNVRAVLAAMMVVAFCGCDLWMNDWKGYLEYWSEAVMMGRVEVSGATFQTNDAGVQTLPLDATAKISGYVINPQGHALVENSIEINEPTLDGSATKNVADPTLISVLLENVTVAEHTTFTVNFTPERADNGIASTEPMSVTLQYNTPPAAPLRMNSDGNGGFEVVQAGGTWNADNDGNLYWKWPYTTTSDTEPNAVKWFSIDGTRHEASSCEEPNNRGIYYFQTGNKSVRIAAVDSEGIVGPSITSGVTVPAGEVIVYQITFNDDGGSGSNNPIPVVYGQELPAVTPPSRTGYTFGGYFTAQNGSGTQYYDGNGAGVKPWAEFSDVTLYAYWTANSYTITFDRAGGTGGSDSISVTYGGTPSSITLPSKAGYTFGGYYTAQNGSGTQYYDGTGAGVDSWAKFSDATLYAKWTANSYTITFNQNGGSGGTTSISVVYDGNPSQITPPSRTGYIFGGYYTAQNGGGTQYYNATGVGVKSWDVPSNTTLYAYWSEIQSISVTKQPTKRLYEEGETFDVAGLQVTATYANGKTQVLSTNDYTISHTNKTLARGAKQTITVTYKHDPSITATFTVNVGAKFHETPTRLPSGTDGTKGTSGIYVEFGDWPQGSKASDVNVDKNSEKTIGIHTYYLGSDGYWYYEKSTNAWFKVEPIKWRVLTTNYNSNYLLLAENVLESLIPYYKDRTNRTINGNTVKPNNYRYSTARVWLNGIFESGDKSSNDYQDRGFLQTAFTSDAQSKIVVTEVDNGEASTVAMGEPVKSNPNICDNTNDKIFLLSKKEASSYGFGGNTYKDPARIRMPTDYAGTEQTKWFLRSPKHDYTSDSYYIDESGSAYYGDYVNNNTKGIGIVPALCISANNIK